MTPGPARLWRERCQACTGETPTLSAADALTLKSELDAEWSVEGDRLRRRYPFANFASAFALATRAALLAEREGHHPDLRVGWGYLEVELTTHAAGGLTRNDFIMAAKLDQAVRHPHGGYSLPISPSAP
ncbi:MAG: 4a-hydroxytetrahydrobiopterin dehydratase [Candidatus Dormiibacterota bacterium]